MDCIVRLSVVIESRISCKRIIEQSRAYFSTSIKDLYEHRRVFEAGAKEGFDLANSADRAIHLHDSIFDLAIDASAIARALASALTDEKYDLIFTGLQSDDYGFAQVGLILAERLGLASATIVMEVQPEEGAVRVKRELESGWFQWVKLPMPALLTIQSGINQLRYATLKGIMAAKKKEIREVKAADVGLTPDDLKPAQVIERAYLPEKTKRTEFIEGKPAEAAAK